MNITKRQFIQKSGLFLLGAAVVMNTENMVEG